jgi:hypothetical protein
MREPSPWINSSGSGSNHLKNFSSGRVAHEPLYDASGAASFALFAKGAGFDFHFR